MRWREGNGIVRQRCACMQMCARFARPPLPGIVVTDCACFFVIFSYPPFTSRKIQCSSRPCPLSTLSLKLRWEGNRWEREGNPPFLCHTHLQTRERHKLITCVSVMRLSSLSLSVSFSSQKLELSKDFSWMCQLEYLWPEIPNLSRSISFGRSAADWSDNILPGFQGYTQTPPPSLSPPTHLYTHREREGTPSLPRSHTCTHERETYTENVCVCVMWV